MASASGCITLSLVLHATLLWGAAGHERSVERHVAIDVVTDAVALGFESAIPRLGDVHGVDAASGAELSAPKETPVTAPVARPAPIREARPVRRAQERAPTKPAVERTLERTAPEPTETRSEPSVASSEGPLVGAAAAAANDAAGAGVAAPGVVSALPGSGTGTASGPANAGNGRGAGVGSTRSDGSDDAARRAALVDYGRRVRARIAERREYPYAARRARLHGTVCLRLELAASGRLLAAEPTCGSSLGPLARAALAAVAKASPFPPVPAALGPRLTLDVPVIFELED